MAVTLMNGFDNQAALSRAAVSGTVSLVPSRDGVGQAASMPANTANVLQVPFPQHVDAATNWDRFGFWVRWSATNVASAWWDFRDTSPAAQLNLSFTSGNLLVLKRSTTTLATGTTVFQPNVWYYLTFEITIADTGGRCVIRVNGVTEVDFTGDTKASTGTLTLGILRFTGNTGQVVDVDDLWFDNAVVHPNMRVLTLAPDGPGASTDWTVTGAATNWQAVGDDLDASYVASETVGHRDLYTYGDLPVQATSVLAVQEAVRGRQVGTGAPKVIPLHRHSDGTVSQGTAQGLAASYVSNAPQVWTVNPATGAAWTVADVNGAQFGIELSS